MKKSGLHVVSFLKTFSFPSFRPGPTIATVSAFVTSAVVILWVGNNRDLGLGEFEAGKVAGRDVIASEQVSYIDHEATRLRMEIQEKLVPAVFKYSITDNQDMRGIYERFVRFSRAEFSEGVSPEDYRLRAGSEFSGLFGTEALDELFHDPQRVSSLDQGQAALEYFIETGVFALPGDLEQYNPGTAELLHNYGERVERERIEYDHIISRDNLETAMAQFAGDNGFPPFFFPGAGRIVISVLRENVFFSPEDTEQRVLEARSQVEPVYRYIERGDKIIRRGFIVTEGEMEQLEALNLTLQKRDPRLIAGQILLIILIYSLLVFHMGKRTAGRLLKPSEVYLMTILAAAYLVGAVLAKHLINIPDDFPLSILLPTALVVMLPAILLGFPLALVTAVLLPLAAFLCEAFDTSAYIFALCSGVAAAHVLEGAKKRMDLIQAGLAIAVANAAAAVTVLLLDQSPFSVYPYTLFWAAFNGLASGMLVIGILPIIEHALNAVTPFRLIELADLNSPILKRLFNAAPGTYSHSIMVANLAESACQEIGANPLLARVGAYYHDIGKMEQPAYFVENQTSYNKHSDINPRLSATVIRSHVKLGIEKARALGLPEAVVDFIAEHHGNSVITWFYNEALKREKYVDMEDFTYPGNPPRTRESAVVMLADVTEAAVRTLKKPTVARMEKYIQELFDAKVQHGQLSHSELTFRDLETIKHAFVKVLAGYYHSRIEYPKIANGGAQVPGANKPGVESEQSGD
jgi:putative nucleotidyltransferase with HDIG domain